MSAETSTDSTTSVVPATDPVTRRRIGAVGLVLGISALVALPAGLLWPSPAAGSETYSYADIQPLRDRWWGLLVFLSANLVLNVPAQALLTTFLVRRRGAAWATAGAAIMWIGTALYAVGVGGWAATYYFATGVDASIGTPLMERIADDTFHLFGAMMIGSLLVAVGTVIQSVGLLRSHVVPRWVPLLWLTIIFTFVIPGNGWVSLITALPMTAAAIGLGYYGWRRTAVVS
jgi:hypothetical protein